MKLSPGAEIGGNIAHIAPEIRLAWNTYQRGPAVGEIDVDYSGQASFEAGVVLCEIATGKHPMP